MPDRKKPAQGATKKKRRKKGRQDVRRHLKPSLGRYVDNYDRTGEHARAKLKKAQRTRAA